MSDQLDQAYDLIKSGQGSEAIDILEDIIRTDRNNEDAWWLFANATTDPEAKRNALNNVLRLSENEDRQNKARTLLQSLRTDQYDFDIDTPSSAKMGAYEAIDDAPAKKSGRFNCATISLILVGLIGVCACIGVFGIYTVAGDIFSFVNPPSDYIDNGILEIGETYNGTLSADNPTAGYSYSGDAGDELVITVTSDNVAAPFIIIYNVNEGFLTAISQTQALSTTASLTYSLPDASEYLITLRSATVLGTDIGFGDYILEADIR
ncbi:MAG: hypothetical protein WBC91_05100 [Phototrophicaceae bacterium]